MPIPSLSEAVQYPPPMGVLAGGVPVTYGIPHLQPVPPRTTGLDHWVTQVEQLLAAAHEHMTGLETHLAPLQRPTAPAGDTAGQQVHETLSPHEESLMRCANMAEQLMARMDTLQARIVV